MSFEHYFGIDPSKCATGLQGATISKSGTLVYLKPFTFTTVAKNGSETHLWYNRKNFINDYQLAKFMIDILIAKVPNESLITIEGYAMAGIGRIADLAEFGGILRYRLLTERQCSIRLVAPTALKLWATGTGNAKKPDMVRAYLSHPEAIIEPKWRLSDQMVPSGTVSALEDIADAFWLANIGYHSHNNTPEWQKFCIDFSKKKSVMLNDEPFITSF